MIVARGVTYITKVSTNCSCNKHLVNNQHCALELISITIKSIITFCISAKCDYVIGFFFNIIITRPVHRVGTGSSIPL